MARTRGADRGGGPESSLDAAMRAPSTQQPDVVVLDFAEEEPKVRDISDPKKDLWLSTSDGRHQSRIIPVRVGPHAEEFPVHREILRKSEYFRRALDGRFQEAENQAIDLPEEDPSIFSFVVAYLYEEKFVPIKPIASVLIVEPEKGKGRKDEEEANSDSGDGSDTAGSASDESARSRRRREQRRRRQERAWEQRQRKEPGRHRPDCNCAACTLETGGPPCWNCGVRRPLPPSRNRWFAQNGMPPQPGMARAGYPPRPRERDRERRRGASRNNVVVPDEPIGEVRMSPEDLRTWSYAYSLAINVYVCANKYLMQDFKAAISAFIINNFEIAGLDAAQPSVLYSCKVLYDGVSTNDPLLKKVFARVGFLQARLWKNFWEETSAFYDDNPKLVAIIMKEMIERREEDVKDDLPAMDRPIPPPPLSPDEIQMIDGPRRIPRY